MTNGQEEQEFILETSDGTKIIYETHGYGPAVLFIHGWAATRNFWKAVRHIEGFRTILFDLRGHGDSDRSKDYSRERILQDIVELLETTGSRELSIVGHSLGGVIATKFAVEYEEYFKINKLILVATPPIFKLGAFRRFVIGTLMTLAPAILQKTFTPKTLHNPNKELLEFIWRESAKGSRIAYIKYLKNWDGASIIEDLKNMELGKYAIIPGDDKTTPTDIQVDYYKDVCQIYKIAEAGHNVMLEKPDEFRRALIEILNKA